ncbi:MAG: O-methyltransferase [Frankia sp.]
MTPKSFFLDTPLHDYLIASTTPLDPLLIDLARETERLGSEAEMQIAPEQGAFLTLLTAAIGARRAVEIGTFTGYSSLCIARGLPVDGHLTCYDVSEEWTTIARRYWGLAGLAERVSLVLGPAAETLEAAPKEPEIDLAFVDADKTGYPGYFEALLPRMSPGGLILFDNVLRGGEVLGDGPVSDSTGVIKTFNTDLAADDRVDVVMLPLADGLTIARVRP